MSSNDSRSVPPPHTALPPVGVTLVAEPRGGPADLDGHKATLDRAMALGPIPGNEEARRDAERRAKLISTIRAQEYALPNAMARSTLTGTMVGGALRLATDLTRFWLAGGFDGGRR